MIELKPCPFCNGTDQMIDAVDDEGEILTVAEYDDECTFEVSEVCE